MQELEAIRSHTISERIRYGIQALEEWEGKPNCAIDMNTFYRKSIDGMCFVCIGGAAIMKVTNGKELRDLPPEYLLDACDLEDSLDQLRLGQVSKAVVLMSRYKGSKEDLTEVLLIYNREIQHYHLSASGFKSDMLKLADDLEENLF